LGDMEKEDPVFVRYTQDLDGPLILFGRPDTTPAHL
jgi:hypothetical protein